MYRKKNECTQNIAERAVFSLQVRTHFIHMPVFIDLLQPLIEEIDAECILMFLSSFQNTSV